MLYYFLILLLTLATFAVVLLLAHNNRRQPADSVSRPDVRAWIRSVGQGSCRTLIIDALIVNIGILRGQAANHAEFASRTSLWSLVSQSSMSNVSTATQRADARNEGDAEDNR